MEVLKTIELSLERFANRLFWWEPQCQKTFSDFAKDLADVRRQFRKGIWLSYDLDLYQQAVYAVAAMCDAWVFVPLSKRYTWEQLGSWRSQIPVTGVLSNREIFLENSSSDDLQIAGPLGACLLIFSSGSTGKAKAIAHSAESLIASAQSTLNFYEIKPGESWLLSLEMSHIGGFQIILRCLLGGLTCVSGFAPHEIVEACRAFPQVNFLSLVPTQLQRLLDQWDKPPAHLRAMLIGGAATPWPLLERAKSRVWPLSITYGSTETASQVSALRVGCFPRRSGDVGHLLPGWSAEVTAEKFILRGPAVCLGWWQERVFHSLDAQTISMQDKASFEDGRLVIEGRRDDVFQIAGENMAPREVLDPLENLGASGDWTLLTIAHEEYGFLPIVVYRGLDQPPSQDVIEAMLQKTLSRLKWPRACYWHKSADQLKPSLAFYRSAIEQGQLEQMWTRI